jgi:5-methylcytosine-specific restriction endonuclease McrA
VIKKNSHRQNYITLNTFKICEVLPFLVDPYRRYETKEQTRRDYPDSKGQTYSVNMKSFRLWTFLTRGTSCVSCGICGKFFLMERDCGNENGPPHFNLYAIDDDEQLVLMTKDHIVPISKGGKNTESNLQTMCTVCNALKKDD